MFYAGNTAQPDVFSSIPAAMWWAVSTLTTVGYGDTLPITTIGKFLGSIIAVMGIGIFALPTAILSASFIEEFRRPTELARCPHCGEELQ